MTKICNIKKDRREVKIYETKDKKFYLMFFFMGELDYEWKRGAHGMFCDITDTLNSAKAKAKRYVNK